jgi:putative flippase GtrA
LSIRALADEHGTAILRYGIVGLTGYALSIGLFALQVEIGVSPYAAVPLGFVVNSLYNFVLNRHWSFGPSGRPIGVELARFWVVAFATLAVNYAVLYLLHDVAGIAAVPSQAAAILVAVPVGYLGQRYWSFGDYASPR